MRWKDGEGMSGNDEDESTTLDFEAAFGSLQETIGQLERGGLTLEDALAAFERGMSLANHCAEILDGAELRVTRILDASSLDLDAPAF